jgi:hypothetical protein
MNLFIACLHVEREEESEYAIEYPLFHTLRRWPAAILSQIKRRSPTAPRGLRLPPVPGYLATAASAA